MSTHLENWWILTPTVKTLYDNLDSWQEFKPSNVKNPQLPLPQLSS